MRSYPDAISIEELAMFQHRTLALAIAAILAGGVTVDAEAQRRGSTTTTTTTTPTTNVNPYSDPWLGSIWGSLSWEISRYSVSGEYKFWEIVLRGTNLSSFWWEENPLGNTTGNYEPNLAISSASTAPYSTPHFALPPIDTDSYPSFPVDFEFVYRGGIEIPQLVCDGGECFSQYNGDSFLEDADVPLKLLWPTVEDTEYGGAFAPQYGVFGEEDAPIETPKGLGTLVEKYDGWLDFISEPDGSDPTDCPAGGYKVSGGAFVSCVLDLFAIPSEVSLGFVTGQALLGVQFASPGEILGGAFVTNTFHSPDSEGCNPLVSDNCQSNATKSRIVGENFRLVPEPGSLALLGLGLAGLGLSRRRRAFAVR